MIAAIRSCYISAHSSRITQYAALRGESIPDEHMAVVVQREVCVRYAALVRVTKGGWFLEAFNGDLSQHIQGEGLPDHVARLQDGKITILKTNNQLPDSFLGELQVICHDMQQAVANRLLRSDSLLEIVSDGSLTYLLQLSFLDSDKVQHLDEPRLAVNVEGTILAEEVKRIGLKGAAMKYFHNSALFELPLWVFSPETSTEMMREQISEKDSGQGYTVRFSHDDALGLPRSFMPNVDKVIQWVLESRRKEWTTIIHPYIKVSHSFEMLVSSESVLVEHIPGMWESDNTIEPDVIIIRNWKARAQISTNSKQVRFVGPNGTRVQTSIPTDLSQIQRWAERIAPAADILRRDLATALPLNIHFVEDTNKLWFFLNIRRGFRLADVPIGSGKPHIVREASDIDIWDKHSPILLRFSIDRGKENRVIEIAEKLQNYRDTPILVDFGLLSHPALILRELGFILVPTYSHLDRRLPMPSYSTYEWTIDHGDEPISRIRRESALFVDEWVRVVLDCDPIVPGHLLVLSEQDVKSFADSGAEASLASLLDNKVASLPPGPWIFVERGRACFCTSGFTNIHAHGHLLPVGRFDKRAIDEFAAELGATRYESLSDALKAARRCDGEYVLVGASNEATYVCVLPNGISFEKRQIRNFFGGRSI